MATMHHALVCRQARGRCGGASLRQKGTAMISSKFHNVIPLRTDTRAMSCLSCEARAACLPAGMDDADCARVDQLVLQRHRLLRGEDLHQINETVRGRVYAVRSGHFKCYRLTPGGDQCITGLPGRGTLLGLEALGQERHASAATATSDSVVCELSHPRLLEAARQFPALERRLEQMLSRELARQHGLAMMLGYARAEQKLACYLLELAWGSRHRDGGRVCVELPLTRQDIGDYLGLTDATVTRQLLRLQREGALQVVRRHVVLADQPRLERMAAGKDRMPAGRPRTA